MTRSRPVRATLAVLAPLVAAGVEHLLWPIIQPFSWFLFYPAVFFSAWVGGFWGAVSAATISTVLAWWMFIPPRHVFLKEDPRYLLPTISFLLMGVLFGIVQALLRRATRETSDALDAAVESSEKLRQSYEDKQHLIEQASDGILIAEVSGQILEANSAACSMLAYPPSEMRERNLRDLVSAGEADQLAKSKEAIEKSGLHIQEWDLLRKTGETCPFEVSAKILQDGRWQIFLRDISERKHAQKRLLQVLRTNRALSRCNEALIRARDEQTLLQTVCEVVVQDAGYPLCWAGRAEPDAAKTVRVLALSGSGGDYVQSLGITWGEDEHGHGPTGTCIRTRQPVIAKNIAGDAEMAPWRIGALRHGYASSLAIPLITEDSEVYGSLSIYAHEPNAFHAEELELLKELADDLAFGITALKIREERQRAEQDLRALNAELEKRVLDRTGELREAREREIDIGRKIQETLLVDQIPSNQPGISIASLSIPTQRIDGDFVIFMEPRSRSFDLVIGDVMGKGVPAALLGAATKAHFIKAFGHLSALEQEANLPEPNEIVMWTDAEIVHQLIALESFVTVCYARVDLEGGVVKIVDCGHTGVSQLHGKTGKAEMLHGDNLPLGVREGELYEQRVFPMASGDTLLFFSDGITEARNGIGELFGPERLLQCVERHAKDKPSTLVQYILQSVVEFCGTEKMADDVTLVAVCMEDIGPPLAIDEMTIWSDLNELAQVRSFVRAFCSRLPAAVQVEATTDALTLAANEAASNIMRHAYRGRTDRKIHLSAEAFENRVVLKLDHHGLPFHPDPPSLPSLEGNRESGMGLYILSQCVDHVRYSHTRPGQNSIVLTCRIGGRGQEREVSWTFQPNSRMT